MVPGREAPGLLLTAGRWRVGHGRRRNPPAASGPNPRSGRLAERVAARRQDRVRLLQARRTGPGLVHHALRRHPDPAAAPAERGARPDRLAPLTPQPPSPILL